MAPLRIGLVSAFPPSTGPLSEYAWHLVNGLRGNRRIERLWVLGDKAEGAARAVDGSVEIVPCWRFDSATYPAAVLRAARALPIDVLWFNLHMTSTGNSRASWFAGLTAPAVARAAGYKVMVTLHNMLGLTELERAGFRPRVWDLAAAHAATALICRAHVVCALRPEYVRLLRARHGAHHALHVPMGAIGSIDAGPGARRAGEILAFGHFGTYKRLETVIEATLELNRRGISARLRVGGTDSRHSPGYLAKVRDRYGTSVIEFLGYVAEADVTAVFHRAQVCILPYSTVTGMSSVAVQAATHGLPIVAADIPAFRAMEREGLRMEFFPENSVDALADTLARFMASDEEQHRQRDANLAYASAQPMHAIADRYLDVAEAVASNPRASLYVTDTMDGAPRRAPVSGV